MAKYSFMDNKHSSRLSLYFKNHALSRNKKESWIEALKYYRDRHLPMAMYIKEQMDLLFTEENILEDQIKRYRIHFRNRINQRFGANLSERDIQDIKEGCRRKKYKLIRGANKNRELYFVEIYGFQLEVIYDKKIDELITAYPYRSWNQGII